MSNPGVITMEIAGHGEYGTTAMGLDRMIAAYLPASVNDLRAKILEMSEEGCEGHVSEDMGDPATFGESIYCDGSCVTTYHNLRTVTECLMILAELNDLAA